MVVRVLLPTDDEGQVLIERNLFAPAEAADIFSALSKSREDIMEREVVVNRGKRHVVARETVHYADKGLSYHYAGVRRAARHWKERTLFGKTVDRIRGAVQKRIGADRKITFAVVNYYKDGTVGLGAHADDEGDLAPGSSIYSVSFGATRDMVFRHKRAKEKKMVVPLPSGSLLTMLPPLQQHWKHEIPKRMRVKEGRFNLTFRHVLASAQ